MKLSNDIKVLEDLVMVLLAKVEALELENAALRAENAEFRSRLNLNSKNSHKPPSSDGLSKKPGLPKGLPQRSSGQSGHKGKTLKMVDKPDEVVVDHVASCPCCAKIFFPADVVDVVQNRQMFDTLSPLMEVTEHQLGVVVCCGRYHLGSFPSDVSQPVQYGSRIKALSVLLDNGYKLPLEKIEKLMGDLWGCSLNESTALTAITGMYQVLEPIEAQIKSAILASDVAQFDETGMQEEKSAHWFHIASTFCFTSHQFMLDLYRDSRKATLILADRLTWERELKYICQLADCEEPIPKQGKRGKPKNTRGRNLLNRLTVFQDCWLAFSFNEEVPFSDNHAERDILYLKTKQKVATNFQTIKGAKHYARIQSFTSTFANIQ